MTYEEAEAFKKSLKSDTYISKTGNKLRLFIVPEEAEGLKVYKSALQWNWETLKDKTARQYTLKDNFILYGIRKMKNGKYAGGPFIAADHPELFRDSDNTEK